MKNVGLHFGGFIKKFKWPSAYLFCPSWITARFVPANTIIKIIIILLLNPVTGGGFGQMRSLEPLRRDRWGSFSVKYAPLRTTGYIRWPTRSNTICILNVYTTSLRRDPQDPACTYADQLNHALHAYNYNARAPVRPCH